MGHRYPLNLTFWSLHARIRAPRDVRGNWCMSGELRWVPRKALLSAHHANQCSRPRHSHISSEKCSLPLTHVYWEQLSVLQQPRVQSTTAPIDLSPVTSQQTPLMPMVMWPTVSPWYLGPCWPWLGDLSLQGLASAGEAGRRVSVGDCC